VPNVGKFAQSAESRAYMLDLAPDEIAEHAERLIGSFTVCGNRSDSTPIKDRKPTICFTRTATSAIHRKHVYLQLLGVAQGRIGALLRQEGSHEDAIDWLEAAVSRCVMCPSPQSTAASQLTAH